MLLGLVVMVWLLPGPWNVGNITLDVHTLLYAAISILVGFQAVNFAVFTKIFGFTAGLLPADARLGKLLRFLSLEAGLFIGGTLALIGLLGSAYAFAHWGVRSFGPLEPTQTLRIVIPASLSLALGCQIILSSFFLSVLRLGRRGLEAKDIC